MTRLLHLSDPHFGAADDSIAESFLARALELSPDLTILSGDLTMRARQSELAAAKRFVDRLPVPHLLIPETTIFRQSTNLYERFFNPFRRYRRAFGNNLEPELIDGGMHVVSLNSSRAFGFHSDWSEGRISKRQLARTTARFHGGPGGHHRVLVLHHPVLAPPGYMREVVKPLPALLGSLGASRVDLVLCGHFHLSTLATAGTSDWKTVISQAPTVCSTRLQGQSQGFHEIHLDGDNMSVIHHVWERGSFNNQPILTFRRTGSGWAM